MLISATLEGADGVVDVLALAEVDRVVRPAFFRALIMGAIKSSYIPGSGLKTRGLMFEDELDLSFVSHGGAALGPLYLCEANFKSGARFDYADLASLNLYGSQSLDTLSLNRARIYGNASFNRLITRGELSLMSAEIGGQLDLSGARLSGVADAQGHIVGDSLSADGAIVRGGVFCGTDDDQRFEAEGTVRLPGAEIGGQLSFRGARLKGPTNNNGHVVGNALSLQRAIIKGSVVFNPKGNRRFEAEGKLNFIGAEVSGQLNLSGARLKGSSDDQGRAIGAALSADGIAIRGDLICNTAEELRFEADGEIRLLGAVIDGQLSLSGASLRGVADAQGRIVGNALSADGALIEGDVFFDKAEGQRFEAAGSVRLMGTKIGGQLILDGASLIGATDIEGRTTNTALSAERISVKDTTFMDGSLSIVGGANFIGATLSDICVAGVFQASTPDAVALDLGDVTLRRLRIWRLEGLGRVNLEGATIDTFDGFNPRLWGSAPTSTTGLELDMDGFVYRRAEICSDMPDKRARKWARFWPWDTHAISENVLDLLDREFRHDQPERVHYMPQPFEQAAKALREAGYDREANAVAVAKREFKRKCRADGKLAAGISWLSCLFFRHGYGPMRASLWMIAFVLMGGGAAWAAQAADLLVTVPSAGQAATRCAEVPLGFALDAFLPLVDLGIDKQCEVSAARPGWWAAEGVRVTYAILGWLFVPMVALTYAGVLRKD